MFVTIINDCRDANAFGRQATRTAALFGCQVHTVAVSGDLEAAGNLIDALDAAEGRKGVILANVAPRHGAAKKWPNGTPFGWFRNGETLVVASIDGLTLSLAKKLGLIDGLRVFDIPEVMTAAAAHRLVPRETAEYVTSTQFRSLEFVPRAACWLTQGYDLPSAPLSSADIADAPDAVWWVDNFGNCKTTVLPEDLGAFRDAEAFAGLASLTHYDRLKDVPDGEAAFVTGSSGLGARRFVEIVIQGGNASQRYGLRSGKPLLRPAERLFAEPTVAVPA
ncbi:MAG TPA: SAM hydroxide adenosyltransferase [Candidatus Binatia bacterium]|jgi:hypothetical protein|nr:SAM hydroxide adenosyltransferase [Candidatus Binatia bacterium]